LKKLTGHHIAPSNVSKASLIDALAAAERNKVITGKTTEFVEFHSLAVYSNELGTLLPSYESDFMNVLTDLWDCKRYDEKKRTTKLDIQIPNPQLSFLAATTPGYMSQFVPEGAWDQGFLARTMLVYSGPGPRVDIFEEDDPHVQLRKDLETDLQAIGNLYGQFAFSPEAREAFRAWVTAGEPPAPTHPKLAYYNTRRVTHLLKLCMIASAASSNALVITGEHYQTALGWLLQLEHAMTDVFKAMTVGGLTRITDETWYWAYEWWLKHKGEHPIPEKLLWEFIGNRAPLNDVPRVINYMVIGGILTEKLVPGIGKAYEVKGRK
jgi:hypothetical protein